MTHDEMMAVIQAHKDGKHIQCLCKHPGAPHEWVDVPSSPVWDFHRFYYRIKPKYSGISFGPLTKALIDG